MASPAAMPAHVEHVDWRALVVASLNLFVCAAGAGLLSFPYAVKNQGIAITIVTTVLAAICSVYTDLIYVSFSNRFQKQLVFGTLEEVATLSIGPRGGKCALFTVVVGCIGAIIGFLILIGDVIVPLAEALCSNDDSSSGICNFCTSRTYMILIFTFVIVIPVSSLPNFSHLTIGSFLAVFSLAVVVFSVIYTGSTVSQSRDLQANSWARNSWTVILGVPIAIFSLGNHSQVAQISYEVSKVDKKAGKAFHLSVISATCLCVVVYLLTGIYGYIAFGDHTLGDVLLNFGIHDTTAAICRSLMAFHIALALPVQVIPLRSALLQHYSRELSDICGMSLVDEDHIPCSNATSGDSLNSNINANNSDNNSNSLYSNPLHHRDSYDTSIIVAASELAQLSDQSTMSSSITLKLVIITSLIVLPCAAVAILLPEIALVFGLLGSSVSTLQIYILPGYMLWIDSFASTSSKSYSYKNAETQSSPSTSLAPPDDDRDDVINSFDNDKGGGDMYVFDDSSDSGYASLEYMPSKPESRRCRGACFVVLGVCIALIGTTTFLLDAFQVIS